MMGLIARIDPKKLAEARLVIEDYYQLSTASDATRARYDVTAERLIRKAKASGQSVIAVAQNTGSSNSWNNYKSALKHAAVKRLSSYLDAYTNNSARDPKWIKSIVKKIDHHVHGYRLLDKATFVETSKPYSKMVELKNLWPEWMEEVCCNADPKYYLPLLVMANTGCRAGELIEGVRVYSADQYLHFEIKGLKTKEKAKIKNIHTKEVTVHSTGQDIRTISVPLINDDVNCHSILVQSLPELIDNYPFETTISIDSTSNLGSAVTAIGHKLYPELETDLTPIMFRHQVVSNMKSSGVSSVYIAKAIGHRSTSTQWRYGNKKYARGYFKPIVKATHPVRIKSKNTHNQTLKPN